MHGKLIKFSRNSARVGNMALKSSALNINTRFKGFENILFYR